MGKKNSHVHLMIETAKLNGLRMEARELGTNVNELIRRKLVLQPIPEEVILLRQLKTILKNKK